MNSVWMHRLMPRKLSEDVGSSRALLARDVEVGDRAHRALSKRVDQYAVLARLSDERRGIRCVGSEPEYEDVRLYGLGIDDDARIPGKTFRDEVGI